jgi:hypothetical protein
MCSSRRKTGGGSYVDASGAIRARASPTVLQRVVKLISGLWTLLVLFYRSIMNPDVGTVGVSDARRSGGGGGGGGGGGRGNSNGGGGGSRYGRIRNTTGSACPSSPLTNSRSNSAQ